jgi:hypothetical protein
MIKTAHVSWKIVLELLIENIFIFEIDATTYVVLSKLVKKRILRGISWHH